MFVHVCTSTIYKYVVHVDNELNWLPQDACTMYLEKESKSDSSKLIGAGADAIPATAACSIRNKVSFIVSLQWSEIQLTPLDSPQNDFLCVSNSFSGA